MFTDATNSIFSFPFIVPSKHWHWRFCSVCLGRQVNQKTIKWPPAQMFTSALGILHTLLRPLIIVCQIGFLSGGGRPTYIVYVIPLGACLCISRSIFYTIYRPNCCWPYNFAAEPPLNTGHKLAPDRGSAAEGWENCTYFVFVPSALHRQQKRNHTI